MSKQILLNLLQGPRDVIGPQLDDCVLFNRKRFAPPEDIEYFNIQLQMNYDLFDEYKDVERITGKYYNSLHIKNLWMLMYKFR